MSQVAMAEPPVGRNKSIQPSSKRFAIPAVPITDEIPRRLPIPATGVHDLLAVQSAVGCRVIRTCRICRVSWCITKKTYSVLKNTVRTPKKSHTQMSLAWRVKNVRQVGDGTPSEGRRMYLATVRAGTENPSRASSAWTRRCPRHPASEDRKRRSADRLLTWTPRRIDCIVTTTAL
jgi:hypothetical protein